jgi:type II secretory pathway component PulF
MTRSDHPQSQKTDADQAARDLFSLEKALLQQEKAISRLMFSGMPISEEEGRLQETLQALREQRLRC